MVLLNEKGVLEYYIFYALIKLDKPNLFGKKEKKNNWLLVLLNSPISR